MSERSEQATAAVRAHFPDDRVSEFRTITADTLALVQKGDQKGAAARITDLETAWDADADTLNATDCQAWGFVDQQTDQVLSAVRASTPNPAQEQQAIEELLLSLPGA